VVAKELCEAGAKVILLEAGQKVDPGQFRSHCWPTIWSSAAFAAEKQERSIRRI